MVSKLGIKGQARWQQQLSLSGPDFFGTGWHVDCDIQVRLAASGGQCRHASRCMWMCLCPWLMHWCPLLYLTAKHFVHCGSLPQLL